ncbi:MAG: peptide-methionine (S)-S-oxide reductase MsrA [Bacteroidia bacterium]|nr:peptide-methionine (S)-S-oxide reductase MsrA [Bacteroidia bacterium]
MEKATLGAGCFWCVEAVFQRLQGVESVISGYTAGHTINPTYKQVCSGETGHAEVAQVTFDPAVISFAEILDVFWAAHDPTTLNRQGEDVGTQYRSGIYYADSTQKEIAENSKKEAQADFKSPIVTEILPLGEFYPAEDYHQNYFNENPGNPYCAFVVGPKVEKFKKKFKDRLKN